MLEVQKLLQESTSLLNFSSELELLGIKMRDYPELEMMMLDYDQIECVKNHPVVNECRGIILSYAGEVICKSFNRFYNLGENGVDTFDFENSTAFEKADGSLIRIYFCPPTGRWEIATRGTAFAEGPHPLHGTFRNAVLLALGITEEKFQEDCARFDHDVTRVYEYVSPDNRIVTPYTTSELVALSFIDNKTHREIVAPPAAIERHSMKWNVREVRQFKFGTLEECMETVANLPNLEEGYVVYNHKTGERVKIKSPAYVAAHRIRGNGLTINSICELVALNEHEEYIAVFPDDEKHFAPAVEALSKMIHELEGNMIAALEHMEQFVDSGRDLQKEFALFVKDLPLSGVLFKARKTGNEIIHEFNQFPVNKRAEWLKESLQTI